MSSLPSLSPRTLAVGNAVAFIVNTIITFTSNAPIYGKTNSQVSNMFDPLPIAFCTPSSRFSLRPRAHRYPTLLTPSGWAFSIWGAIFAAQGVWTAWQVIPRNHSNRFTASIGVWWWIVCAVQCCWTFAFAQEQIGLALAFMIAILLALVGIAAALSKHRAVVRPSSPA
jgi:translocator protein